MLNLLLDSSFWYEALVILAVVLIIYVLAKYPAGKYYAGSIVFLALLIGAVYCGIQLNFYYSAQGGIFGYITGVTAPTTVDVTDDFEFDFKNIELLQEEGNTYSVHIFTKDVVKLDDAKTYGIYVNDIPSALNVYSSHFMSGSYGYAFKDRDNALLCYDRLEMSFAFDNDSTTIDIRTEGGSTAVKYWNNYFNRNKFVVSIKEFDYTASEGELGTGVIGEYYTVEYYTGYGQPEPCAKQLYRPGYKLVAADPPENNGNLTFNYWKYNEDKVDFSNTFVDQDMKLYSAWTSMLGYEVKDGVVTKSLGTSQEIVIDEKYSLSPLGYPIKGTDYSITSVANAAFKNDKVVITVRLDGNIDVGQQAFFECPNLKTVRIDDVKTLGVHCFALCEKLDTIQFVGTTLTELPSYCFYMTAVSEIKLSSSITYIDTHCFEKCTNLVKADLNQLNAVEQYAFNGCSQLSTVIFRNTKKVVLPNVIDSFGNCPNVNYYVPDEMLSKYQSTARPDLYWTPDNIDRVKPISELG